MTASPIVRYGGAFLGVALVAAIVGTILRPGVPSTTPQSAASNPPPQLLTAPIPADDPPLTGNAALEAFNSYMIDVQAKLQGAQFLESMWLSRVRQDVKFGNLEAYRKDAAEMKAAAMQSSSDLVGIAPPDNFTDEDAKYFDDVREAASTLVGAHVDLAVDVAVTADFGMDEALDEAPKIAQTAKSARTALKAAALKGFAHFGAPAARVSMETLTLKPEPSTAT